MVEQSKKRGKGRVRRRLFEVFLSLLTPSFASSPRRGTVKIIATSIVNRRHHQDKNEGNKTTNEPKYSV